MGIPFALASLHDAGAENITSLIALLIIFIGPQGGVLILVLGKEWGSFWLWAASGQLAIVALFEREIYQLGIRQGFFPDRQALRELARSLEELEARAQRESIPGEPIEGEYEPVAQFEGARLGWVYKSGAQGLGYYNDRPVMTACGSSDGGQPPMLQEDGGSESGGDDYSSSGWSISRIGLGGARNPEKQGLIPKRDVEAGGGGCSSPLGGLSSAPWSALQTVRDYGVAGATTVGSTIGLVEKPKVPETRLEKLCRCCPTLTYKQRLLGFGFCFFFGVSLSLSALNSLPSLLLGNPAPFAFKYTLGNLLAIGSSSFLVGPVKQLQDMAAPERRTASLVYVSSLCATLLSVFVLKWQLVSFVLVVIQFGALTWYMLSYVPYGQQIFKRFLSRLM
jgi:hypothetical protein